MLTEAQKTEYREVLNQILVKPVEPDYVEKLIADMDASADRYANAMAAFSPSIEELEPKVAPDTLETVLPL